MKARALLHSRRRRRRRKMDLWEDEGGWLVVGSYLGQRYVCTQALCTATVYTVHIPRANNNATSRKWDGYPYLPTCDDA